MPYVMEVQNPADELWWFYTDHGRKPVADLQHARVMVLDAPAPRDPGDDEMLPMLNPVDAVGVTARWVEIVVADDGTRTRA